MNDQTINPVTAPLTDETAAPVENPAETAPEASPETVSESTAEALADTVPVDPSESAPTQDQTPHFTYEQAPPAYNQAPPMYNQAPPAYNQAPPVYNQAPPAYNQAPPVYNQTPPAYNQAPPVYNQAPPPYNQAPPTYDQAPPAYNQAPPTYNQAPPTYNQAPPTYNQAPPMYNQAPPVPNQAPPAYIQTPPVYNQAPPANPAKKRSGAALGASLALAFATVVLLGSWFLPVMEEYYHGASNYYSILDTMSNYVEDVVSAGVIVVFGIFNIVCAFLNKKWAAVMGVVSTALCSSSAVYMLTCMVPNSPAEYRESFGAYMILSAAVLMMIFSAVKLALACKPDYAISRPTLGAAMAATFAAVMSTVSWYLPLYEIYYDRESRYVYYNMLWTIVGPDKVIFCVFMIICALNIAWSVIPKGWAALAGVITSALCTLFAVWQTMTLTGLYHREPSFGIYLLIPCAALALIFNLLKLIFASKDKKKSRMNNAPQPGYMQ